VKTKNRKDNTIGCINILKKTLAISLLIGGLAGSILFFPFLLEKGYTCLYHRLFAGDQPVHIATQKQITDSNRSKATLVEQKFMRHYFRHYVFVWWFSLALTALIIWRWKWLGPGPKHDRGPASHFKIRSARSH